MNHFYEKIREVAASVLPVTILVTVLHFTIVDLPGTLIWRFLFCALFIILGLGIFLAGADLGIRTMGDLLGKTVAKSRHPQTVGFIGFLLGFFITIAEPDLIILGKQIEDASGGALNAMIFVVIVSVGVGLLVSVGLYRILLNASYRIAIAACYALIFLLALFVTPEFIAFGFDASGATTGAMTTPFILAIGVGLSQIKQSKSADEDSFGMVGLMSAGPIIAVLTMAIFMGQGGIEADIAPKESQDGIFYPLFSLIPHTALESLVAITPVALIFFICNKIKIKASPYDIKQIIRGLIYTITGLVLFLAGVNAGFLETGQLVGRSIAQLDTPFVLPLLGLMLGLVTVLAEPAVYVLCTQVQDVTAGHIPRKLLLIALSLGVGIAVCLSMLRIIIEPLQLWHILLPGFLVAVLLSFYVPSIFVGIAFDAGGVASGPMTATFILSLTQGAALMTPTANILTDGFGVIATVAMTPIIAILILGAIYKRKQQKLLQQG